MIKQQRLATIGPPRQQGVDGAASKTATPYLALSGRLLRAVSLIGMLMATWSSAPPPIAPARRRQENFRVR